MLVHVEVDNAAARTVPEAELHVFQQDLRSLSQGMATFEAEFDHLSEVTEKVAGTMTQRDTEAA